MDIEGAEEAIFEGDTRWLQQVRQVLMEIHVRGQKSVALKVLTAARFITSRLHHDGSPSNLFLAKKYP